MQAGVKYLDKNKSAQEEYMGVGRDRPYVLATPLNPEMLMGIPPFKWTLLWSMLLQSIFQ